MLVGYICLSVIFSSVATVVAEVFLTRVDQGKDELNRFDSSCMYQDSRDPSQTDREIEIDH